MAKVKNMLTSGQTATEARIPPGAADLKSARLTGKVALCATSEAECESAMFLLKYD